MKFRWLSTIAVLTLFLIYQWIIVLPQPVLAAATATDTFTRSTTGGWGTAVLGGAYSYGGSTSSFSTNGTVAQITTTFAGSSREAYLSTVSQTDIDGKIDIRLSAVPAGGGYWVDLVGRRINSSNSYKARVEFKADGSLMARLIAFVGGTELTVASATVPGITYTANTWLTLRARFLGTNSTNLEMRVWETGQAEPGTWLVSGTDNSAALQAAGSLGVAMSSSSDAGLATVSFDNLDVNDGNLVNQSPTVNAGTDGNISIPNTFTAAATVTDDNFIGFPLTRTWSQISGPGVITFTPNTSTEDVTMSFSQAGTYVAQLQASDTEFTVNDTVQIIVAANSTPTVNAGTDRTISLPNTAVMAATVTDNAPGYTMLWTVDSGPAGTSFNNAALEDPTVTFTQTGIYVLRLTASDGEFSPFDTVQITVDPNTAPVVDVGTDKNGIMPDGVAMTATVTDNAPLTLLRTWTKISGPGTVTFLPDASIEDPTVSFSQEGVYVLQLEVSDGQFSITDTVQVTMAPEPDNTAPTVDAGLPQIIQLPSNVFLNATVSDDGRPNGQSLQYTWSKVSGPGTVTFVPSGTIEDPQASFSQGGTYVLRLSVSDSEFITEDTVTITVGAAPVPSPTPVSKQEVFRFWSDRYQGHFFTANPQERDYVLNTYPQSVWRYEGIAFNAALSTVPGAIPVYRFWSDTKKTHFYTANEEERIFVIDFYPDSVWRYEGIAFYQFPLAYSSKPTVRVSRFWSDKFQSHFYTASETERKSLVNDKTRTWRFEGYAWRSPE